MKEEEEEKEGGGLEALVQLVEIVPRSKHGTTSVALETLPLLSLPPHLPLLLLSQVLNEGVSLTPLPSSSDGGGADGTEGPSGK